jgi:23S rRNA pseudouridine1911/1915/1917 synthase
MTVLRAPAATSGRADAVVAATFPELSRSRAAALVKEGAVRVDGVAPRRVSDPVAAGASIEVEVPDARPAGVPAQDLELSIVYQDDDVVVIDKAAGMVVHPSAGHEDGTLVNALLHHVDGLSGVGGVERPGIVHRLDRDTSGVIVVARSEDAHHRLAKQFERRSVEKTYLAITQGQPQFDRDEINLPIGIHPYQREKMAVRRDHSTSREAVTRFEVVERFGRAALVRVTPKTGRTHQIRVHLAAIGSPVLCDGLYSGRTMIDRSFFGGPAGPPLIERQALHAASLAIDHPATGERLFFEAPLPADMQRVLAVLRGT